MKTSFTVSLFILSLVFINCSRKTMVIRDDHNYKLQSQQLEMNYPVTDNTLSASASTENIIINENRSRLETESSLREEEKVNRAVKMSSGKAAAVYTLEKTHGNKLVNKILARKIEKALRKNSGVTDTHVATGRLRTGIILGAVGLGLLVMAQFFGAASSVVYVAGAVLFIVGVVFILLETL